MDAKYTGNMIAELRKRKRLTQKELADVLHVTDKAVSKWERGLNFPELTLWEPLAAALDTTVMQLLALEEASSQQLVTSLSQISMFEKEKQRRQLHMQSYLKIILELILMAAMIAASKIFADNQIYGFAQVLTIGMIGFIGVLIGSEIYSVRTTDTLSR